MFDRQKDGHSIGIFINRNLSLDLFFAFFASLICGEDTKAAVFDAQDERREDRSERTERWWCPLKVSHSKCKHKKKSSGEIEREWEQPQVHTLTAFLESDMVEGQAKEVEEEEEEDNSYTSRTNASSNRKQAWKRRTRREATRDLQHALRSDRHHSWSAVVYCFATTFTRNHHQKHFSFHAGLWLHFFSFFFFNLF